MSIHFQTSYTHYQNNIKPFNRSSLSDTVSAISKQYQTILRDMVTHKPILQQISQYFLHDFHIVYISYEKMNF